MLKLNIYFKISSSMSFKLEVFLKLAKPSLFLKSGGPSVIWKKVSMERGDYSIDVIEITFDLKKILDQ